MAAITSLAITAGTTAASFAQQSKQNKLAAKAKSDAAKAMSDIKKGLNVNYFDQLGIQKEPYRMASEQLGASVAQATEAGRESERGAAATAGRSVAASVQGQREIASQMAKDMQQLDALSAQEDAANRNKLVDVNIEEIKGANAERQWAERTAQQAGQQALQGVGSLITQGAQMLSLYGQNKEISDFAEKIGGDSAQENLSRLGTVNGVDFSKVSSMNKADFNSFLYGLSPLQRDAALNQFYAGQRVNPFATDWYKSGKQSLPKFGGI